MLALIEKDNTNYYDMDRTPSLESEKTLITNLDFILRLTIFKSILDGTIWESNIDDFTKKFNEFFFEAWKIWYADADKIGIDTAKEYTKEQVEKFVSAIQESVASSDDDIKVQEIDNAPCFLASELASETGGFTSELRKWDVNFWLLKWNEVIWYVNWSFWDLGLSVSGLYIVEKYRKKWLGIQLLDQMMKKSVEKWFSRLDLSDASWKWQDALRNLAKKYDEEWEDVQFQMWHEDLNNFAILELNNKGQDNSYFKEWNDADQNFIKS